MGLQAGWALPPPTGPWVPRHVHRALYVHVPLARCCSVLLCCLLHQIIAVGLCPLAKKHLPNTMAHPSALWSTNQACWSPPCSRQVALARSQPAGTGRECTLVVHAVHPERRQCLLVPVMSLAAFATLHRPAYAALVDDDRAAAVFEATSAHASLRAVC